MSKFFLKVPEDFAQTIGRFDLSIREVQVLLQLFSHRNRETGACYPSQLTIAKEIGIGHRYVRVCVASLKRKGFLKTTCKRLGGSNHYSFNLSPLENPVSEDEKKTRITSEWLSEVAKKAAEKEGDVDVMASRPTGMPLHPSFAGRENEIDPPHPPHPGEDFDTYQARVFRESEEVFKTLGGNRTTGPVIPEPPPPPDQLFIDDGGFGAQLLKEVLESPEPPPLGTAEYEEFYKKLSTPKPREEVMKSWVEYEHRQGRDPLAAIARAESPEESHDGVPESEVRGEANRGQGPGPAENHPPDHEDHQ